jgi:hypothetical protein
VNAVHAKFTQPKRNPLLQESEFKTLGTVPTIDAGSASSARHLQVFNSQKGFTSSLQAIY